jgi:hypothetical protein
LKIAGTRPARLTASRKASAQKRPSSVFDNFHDSPLIAAVDSCGAVEIFWTECEFNRVQDWPEA